MEGRQQGEEKRSGTKQVADVEGWPEPDALRSSGWPGQPDTAAGVAVFINAQLVQMVESRVRSEQGLAAIGSRHGPGSRIGPGFGDNF
jgi:hypothetical protein